MTREEALQAIRAKMDYYESDKRLRGAIETLVPELRESEDERIRKEIIECIETLIKAPGASPRLCDWLAYLEKQKERRDYRKLYEDIAKSEWFKQTYVGKSLGCDEEQKPAQTDDEKEYIRTLKSLISDFIRDKHPEDVAFYQKIYDWLEGRHIEQKPVEPSDDELQRHQDELYDFKVFATKQAKEHHISFVHDFEWNNFCAGLLSYFHEQKPAEWSEDFDKEVENVHKRYPEVSFAKLTRIAYHFSKWANRCKDKEWSEEDEKILRTIISDGSRGVELDSKQIAWLKSLRPDSYKNCNSRWKPSEEQQKEQKYIGLSETDKFFLEGVANVLVDNEYKDAAKRLRDLSESLYLQPKGVWREEDERLIKTTIAFLKDFADTGWENAVECIDWLKSLRPSWKPTYEQMEALRKAVIKLADTEVADSVRLSIMYDHLKKLV